MKIYCDHVKISPSISLLSEFRSVSSAGWWCGKLSLRSLLKYCYKLLLEMNIIAIITFNFNIIIVRVLRCACSGMMAWKMAQFGRRASLTKLTKLPSLSPDKSEFGRTWEVTMTFPMWLWFLQKSKTLTGWKIVIGENSVKTLARLSPVKLLQHNYHKISTHIILNGFVYQTETMNICQHLYVVLSDLSTKLRAWNRSYSMWIL